jgi:hypothetical protein
METDEDQFKSLDARRPLTRRGIGIGAVGMGDAIKVFTKMLGIEPCAECEKRATRLNGLSGRNLQRTLDRE